MSARRVPVYSFGLFPAPADEASSISSIFIGAGNGVRTRDPKLGKLVLYQLSYSRTPVTFLTPPRAARNPARNTAVNIRPSSRAVARGDSRG